MLLRLLLLLLLLRFLPLLSLRLLRLLLCCCCIKSLVYQCCKDHKRSANCAGRKSCHSQAVWKQCSLRRGGGLLRFPASYHSALQVSRKHFTPPAPFESSGFSKKGNLPPKTTLATMEALGVASSVIAVVDISAKIASLCLQYARQVKHAKDSINQLCSQVTDLGNASLALQKLLNGPHGSGLSVSQQLQGAITNSLSELRQVHDKLRPKSAREAMSRLGLRSLKWPFESKSMDQIMQNLGHYMRTISLALEIDQT